MHLKITLSGWGSKMSDFEPGFGVSLVCEIISPMVSWHQTHSDKYKFHLLIPGSSLVPLLKMESWFEIVTQLADTGKCRSSYL
jgi:hypothetical protein